MSQVGSVVRCVLIRKDDIPEIRHIIKYGFEVSMHPSWPDGKKGKFYKISRKGYLFYKEI